MNDMKAMNEKQKREEFYYERRLEEELHKSVQKDETLFNVIERTYLNIYKGPTGNIFNVELLIKPQTPIKSSRLKYQYKLKNIEEVQAMILKTLSAIYPEIILWAKNKK